MVCTMIGCSICSRNVDCEKHVFLLTRNLVLYTSKETRDQVSIIFDAGWNVPHCDYKFKQQNYPCQMVVTLSYFMEARFLVLKSKEIMKTYILGSHKYYLKKTRLNMKTLQNSGEISIKRLFFRITQITLKIEMISYEYCYQKHHVRL